MGILEAEAIAPPIQSTILVPVDDDESQLWSGVGRAEGVIEVDVLDLPLGSSRGLAVQSQAPPGHGGLATIRSVGIGQDGSVELRVGEPGAPEFLMRAGPGTGEFLSGVSAVAGGERLHRRGLRRFRPAQLEFAADPWR
jgi:hypothetical protein